MQKIFFSILILSFLIVGTGPVGILSGSYGVKGLAQNNDLPSPGLTPDSPFYFLKSWKESIQTFFTFGAENKAKQFLHLAEVRLAEYQKMIEKGKTEIAEKTLEKYEKQLNHALEKAEEAKEGGKDVEELAALIAEKTLKHQEVLVEIFDKVPEQAKTAIQKAIEASKKDSEEAVKAVSGTKKDELFQEIERIEPKLEEKGIKISDGFGGGGPEILEEPESKELPPQPLGPTKPKNPMMSDLDTSAIAGMPFTISWHDFSPADSKATSYLLGRDTNSSFSDPVTVYSGPLNSFTGTLSPSVSTLYYFKAKACNNYGCSSWGNVTIVFIEIPAPSSPEPKITVTSPNGGETWKAGNTYAIQWKSIGLAKVRLNLLSQHKDDPFTYDVSNIALEVDAAQGSYSWHVPAEMLRVSQTSLFPADYPCHKIVVVDSRYGRDSQVAKVYSDESDSCFSIIDETAPNTPAMRDDIDVSITAGTPYKIGWAAVSRVTTYILERDINSSFSNPTAVYSGLLNSFRDTLSPSVSTTYYFRVKARNNYGCSSWSKVVDMQVIIPSITVNSPNGGEKWVSGETYDVTWTSVGVDKITLRVNYGSGYLGLGATIPSTGADATLGKFTWQIAPNLPYVPGDNLKIKITDDSNSTIYDESDNFFSIVEP